MSGIETRYRNSSGLQGRLIHSCVLAEFLREMKLYLAMMGGMALHAGFLARSVNFAGDTYFWEYNHISLWHYRSSTSSSQVSGRSLVCLLNIFPLGWCGHDETTCCNHFSNLGWFPALAWGARGSTRQRGAPPFALRLMPTPLHSTEPHGNEHLRLHFHRWRG